MPESHSREGKRVEKTSVDDDPHVFYRGFDPWTGEKLKHGIPVTVSTSKGNVVLKNVNHSVVKCPECNVPARYTADEEPVCPICGIICSGKDGQHLQQVVIDAKSAGRIES